MDKTKGKQLQFLEHVENSEEDHVLPISKISFSRSTSYQFLPYISPPRYALLQSSSKKDTKGPAPLNVIRNSTWTYAGPILSSLPPSFYSWSKFSTSNPSLLFARLQPLLAFLHATLAESGVQCYWITIRATTPTKEFDMRRWHVDEVFFAPGSSNLAFPQHRTPKHNRNDWKLCATLLGPSTVFMRDNKFALRTLHKAKEEARKDTDHQCTQMRCVGCSTYADAVRAELSTLLSSRDEVVPPPHAVAVFKTGHKSGAVHSEPRCHVDRVFVNVVPGTEEELKKVMEKWGMGWPRAWCWGGDVRSDEAESF